MTWNLDRKGLVEADCTLNRLSDELDRVKRVAMFLAQGVMGMQAARKAALELSPEDCKKSVIREFPLLRGKEAERLLKRWSTLEDVGAEQAVDQYLGKAGQREHEGWISVTSRHPCGDVPRGDVPPCGDAPQGTRRVLVLLDTGGVAISRYLSGSDAPPKATSPKATSDAVAPEPCSELEPPGRWLDLPVGCGTVTHWHELPPLKSAQEREAVLAEYRSNQKPGVRATHPPIRRVGSPNRKVATTLTNHSLVQVENGQIESEPTAPAWSEERVWI